ncbi:MAG: STAS domain-containing protein [Rhodothermaceae bacterium]|nr:STAS domain-containing protein [Rhodothermaceae bacterium]
MDYPVTEHYHAVVLPIKGRFFGSVNGPGFTEAVDRLREEGKRNLVLDLSKAKLMDSSGIGVLIETAKTLRDEGGDIRLSGMEDQMRNLFLMTKLLGPVFQSFANVDEAVASYAPGAEANASDD